MAVTLHQQEATPENYPAFAAPEGIEPEAVWRRLETYINHRFSPRTVTFIIEGAGQWVPPLEDTLPLTFETWGGNEWLPADPGAAPMGYSFKGDGPHRVLAMVGKTTAPADVTLAATRFASYLAEAEAETAIPGATGGRNEVGDVAWSVERSAHWLADAMRKSGAADLLRPYRKPKGCDYSNVL